MFFCFDFVRLAVFAKDQNRELESNQPTTRSASYNSSIPLDSFPHGRRKSELAQSKTTSSQDAILKKISSNHDKFFSTSVSSDTNSITIDEYFEKDPPRLDWSDWTEDQFFTNLQQTFNNTISTDYEYSPKNPLRRDSFLFRSIRKMSYKQRPRRNSSKDFGQGLVRKDEETPLCNEIPCKSEETIFKASLSQDNKFLDDGVENGEKMKLQNKESPANVKRETCELLSRNTFICQKAIKNPKNVERLSQAVDGSQKVTQSSDGSENEKIVGPPEGQHLDHELSLANQKSGSEGKVSWIETRMLQEKEESARSSPLRSSNNQAYIPESNINFTGKTAIYSAAYQIPHTNSDSSSTEINQYQQQPKVVQVDVHPVQDLSKTQSSLIAESNSPSIVESNPPKNDENSENPARSRPEVDDKSTNDLHENDPKTLKTESSPLEEVYYQNSSCPQNEAHNPQEHTESVVIQDVSQSTVLSAPSERSCGKRNHYCQYLRKSFDEQEKAAQITPIEEESAALPTKEKSVWRDTSSRISSFFNCQRKNNKGNRKNNT